MERLILICEGGAHTVEYFHKNGVYPGAVVFDTTKFREMAPYLTKDDEILIVIKGLTDFSLAEIYALLNDVNSNVQKVKGITIMSNVHLGKISTPYYLYYGDLFYGNVKEIKNGKFVEGEVTESVKGLVSKSFSLIKKEKLEDFFIKTDEKSSNNTVMLGYKKYNKRDIKFKIYGSKLKDKTPSNGLDAITKKVIVVDLFKNNGNKNKQQ